MNIDLLHRYFNDARRAYGACVVELGVSGAPTDLMSMLRATRNRELDRKGQVATSSGEICDYHVHGTGYSFTEQQSGKIIHFDVILIEGVGRIRFSAWKFHQYALSVGESISEETLTSELRRISAEESIIVHVTEGPSDYYVEK